MVHRGDWAHMQRTSHVGFVPRVALWGSRLTRRFQFGMVAAMLAAALFVGFVPLVLADTYILMLGVCR